MFCSVYCAAVSGLDPQLVSVEADVSGGLPNFYMVGLPSSEVREARERVLRAIANAGFDLPARKITINLSPANVRKNGAGFDLPIAMAILAAAGLIHPNGIRNAMFLGELGLDGKINPVKGVLPIALYAKEQGIKRLIIPMENASEGCYVSDLEIYGSRSLKELAEGLKNGNLYRIPQSTDWMNRDYIKQDAPDFADVRGQDAAKRATMIAVAGFHHLLYIGPPGAGKSLMARRIPSLFEDMSPDEILEISKIYSIAGLLPEHQLIRERPFRAPHHNIPPAALVGGAVYPKPGEITLAHKGVLFLDEAAEMKKNTIELLRQPLEEKQILISRMNAQVTFPAEFMLVMALNPCPCGYYPDHEICQCTPQQVRRYFGKIRGPVLDRIDIAVSVPKLKAEDLSGQKKEESSAEMRTKIRVARKMQEKRFHGTDICFNAQMDRQMIEAFCPCVPEARQILDKAYDTYKMTARGYYRAIKVARTIADMEEAPKIQKEHILEAISYRLDVSQV